MIKTKDTYQQFVAFVECTPLRKRTKAEYLRQVRRLTKHYAIPLNKITERQVFDYLVHRRDQEKARPATLNQAVVAIRGCYRDCLGLHWKLWGQFKIKRDRPLPVVLTQAETERFMAAVDRGYFKAPLARMYHCGLRPFS